MNGLAYRGVTIGQALCYCGLAVSILIRPPIPRPGQTTVFDVVADASIWSVVFFAIAAIMIAASLRAPSNWIARVHSLMIPIMAGWGTANLGVSLLSHVGWQVAALSYALLFGHAHAIVSRPEE